MITKMLFIRELLRFGEVTQMSVVILFCLLFYIKFSTCIWPLLFVCYHYLQSTYFLSPLWSHHCFLGGFYDLYVNVWVPFAGEHWKGWWHCLICIHIL